MNQNFNQLSEDYKRVAKAIEFIDLNADRQPSLKEVAASVNLSEFHFQRLFKRWAGISPKRFLQFLTKENVKTLIRETDLLDTTYSAGLSSPGRLHDLFVNCEAVTPGEYKLQGAGLQISYGFHPTPYGECLLAATDRGICFLAFVIGSDRKSALKEMKLEWKKASWIEDPEKTRHLVDSIFSSGKRNKINLYIRGTNFQIKVWEALLRIPPGHVSSYESLAFELGNPSASRAVGNALAHNPVAYIIPCHRVLRKMGDFGNYRYGKTRKKAILVREIK